MIKQGVCQIREKSVKSILHEKSGRNQGRMAFWENWENTSKIYNKNPTFFLAISGKIFFWIFLKVARIFMANITKSLITQKRNDLL